MHNKDSIGRDFNNKNFSKEMCKLITQKTLSLLQFRAAEYDNFKKILNPYANPNILNNISIKIFDDASEKSIVNGIDKLIDTILREHLFFYKINMQTIDIYSFGNFSKEEIISTITQIIDDRITVSFIEAPLGSIKPQEQAANRELEDAIKLFGEFDEIGIINGAISLIRMKLTKNKDFSKILYKEIDFNKIKTNISSEIFGEFDEMGLAHGIDKIIDIILKQYLISFYKSKAIELSIFGDFDEAGLVNGISKLINIRLTESLNYYESQLLKQTTYNNSNANQYIYILYNEILYQEYNTHIYKIGWTSRTPQIRADEISQGTGVIDRWKVGHQWKVEDGYWLEQQIFKHFSQYRLPYSEQFNFKGLTIEQVAEKISQFINNLGESPKRAAQIAEKQRQKELQNKALQERLAREQQDREIQRLKKAHQDEIDQIEERKLLEQQIKNKVSLYIQTKSKPYEENISIAYKVYWVACIGLCFLSYSQSEEFIPALFLSLGSGFFLGVVLIIPFIFILQYTPLYSEINTIKKKCLKYENLPYDLNDLKRIRDEVNALK